MAFDFNISEMRQDSTKVILRTNRKSLSIGAKNQRPLLILKGHIMHSVSKHARHGVVVYLLLVSHSVCF